MSKINCPLCEEAEATEKDDMYGEVCEYCAEVIAVEDTIRDYEFEESLNAEFDEDIDDDVEVCT